MHELMRTLMNDTNMINLRCVNEDKILIIDFEIICCPLRLLSFPNSLSHLTHLIGTITPYLIIPLKQITEH
jgi:hypothetical protein